MMVDYKLHLVDFGIDVENGELIFQKQGMEEMAIFVVGKETAKDFVKRFKKWYSGD